MFDDGQTTMIIQETRDDDHIATSQKNDQRKTQNHQKLYIKLSYSLECP